MMKVCQSLSRKSVSFSKLLFLDLHFVAISPNCVSFIQVQINHFESTLVIRLTDWCDESPTQPHTPTHPRTCSSWKINHDRSWKHVITVQSRFTGGDNLDLSLIGFWIYRVSALCVTAPTQMLCGMKQLNQMFPFKRWAWLRPPLIGEVTTNRPLVISPLLVFSSDPEGFSERAAVQF